MKSGKGVAALERRTDWKGSSLTRRGKVGKVSGGDIIVGDVVELPVVTQSFP